MSHFFLTFEIIDDPIKGYVRDEDEERKTDSVSSLMLGLFSAQDTAKLFYTADLEVLLDVILRRLTDYGPGDKVWESFYLHSIYGFFVL